MTRTEFLRKQAQETAHGVARIAMPQDWSTADMNCSLDIRKAYAIKMLLDNMPLYIGEQELIVGTRTIYGYKQEQKNNSDMELFVMPKYLNDEDIKYFGYDGSKYCKAHYTCDYGIILQKGIDGIIGSAKKRIANEKNQDKADYLNSIIIAYEGLSGLISRYSEYAKKLAEKETDTARKAELLEISEVCKNIAYDKPKNLYEAAQLFWFSHLSVVIENYWFVNYGRVDQFLYPFFDSNEGEKVQQLIDCLLLKMYDALDISDDRTGNYAGQHNITIGGVDKDGNDAVNELSYMFVSGLSRTRFPEPEVAVRINSKNPREFLVECSKLSVSGLNCIAYYNDDQFIESMVAAGIEREDANNYAFDLCQDINIPGKGDFYASGSVSIAHSVLKAMKKSGEKTDLNSFIELCKAEIKDGVKSSIENYNKREKAIREFADGNKSFVTERLKSGELSGRDIAPIMAPLPLTSALYEGCIESGRDINRFGCLLEDKGCMVCNLVVGINSLAAIRKNVFDLKKYTMGEIIDACNNNFEDNEILRQDMWNAPKWANDDDYVDLPAKELIEFACDEFLKYRTPNGARHLAGIHQPHPVFAGEGMPATPEGRLKGTPIPVTLSPENGTMLNGPLSAFKSAAKIDPMKYQWNNCVMLQYFSSVFESNGGADLFADMLLSYFKIGGAQHQPNIVNVGDFKAAREHPEEYKDLVVRMWGVSAHFVTLPRDIQDEFISRFENI